MSKHNGGVVSGLVWGIVALVGACCPTPRPTPTPSFATRVDSTSRATVLAYIDDSLHFDTAYAIGETRRLMRGTCPGNCSYGPRVRFEPEKGAASLGNVALAQGRVLARLVNLDTAVTDSYPKFNLRGGDTVYWWVDSGATGWRSLYIPRDTARAISPPDSFTYEHHKDRKWYRSYTKYIWRDTDEALWVTCSQGCCKTSSGGP